MGSAAVSAASVSVSLTEPNVRDAHLKGSLARARGARRDAEQSTRDARATHFALYATMGHLKVDAMLTRWPVACDSRAAVMISRTCKACSGVTKSSLPVTRHSAASAAPICQR